MTRSLRRSIRLVSQAMAGAPIARMMPPAHINAPARATETACASAIRCKMPTGIWNPVPINRLPMSSDHNANRRPWADEPASEPLDEVDAWLICALEDLSRISRRQRLGQGVEGKPAVAQIGHRRSKPGRALKGCRGLSPLSNIEGTERGGWTQDVSRCVIYRTCSRNSLDLQPSVLCINRRQAMANDLSKRAARIASVFIFSRTSSSGTSQGNST